MVLESLLDLVLPLLSALFRSALFSTTATILSVFGAIWLLRRQSNGLCPSLRRGRTSVLNRGEEAEDSHRAMNAEEEDDDAASPPEVPEYERIPYEFRRLPPEEMIKRSAEFLQLMKRRRTIRSFSSDRVPWEVMENLLKTAGSSPSGANAQPWTYVVISDQKTKEEVRRIVEIEEEINYERRMGKQWVDDLKPFKLSWEKPYLTEAPHLILVFKQVHSYDPKTGKKKAHYYQEISVSLSVGILLAAIQNAGLVTLTSTPLNCGPALRTLLNRPEYEKLVLLLPVGYPAADATVPKLERKELKDFVVRI